MKPTRRALLLALAGAPVAAAVAPQAVASGVGCISPGTAVDVPVSGLTCRFYSSYTNAARDAQRTFNWYVSGHAERVMSWPPPVRRKRYRRIETRFDPTRLPA